MELLVVFHYVGLSFDPTIRVLSGVLLGYSPDEMCLVVWRCEDGAYELSKIVGV